MASSEPTTPKTPKTPKTPNSKDDQLSSVYGSPIQSLDSNASSYTDCDLICLWMGFYDNFRSTSFHMQQSDKNEVINQVAQYLVTFWPSKFPSTEILPLKAVITKVAGLVNRVQKLIKNGTYRKCMKDLKSIEKERTLVSRCFDIASKPSTKKVSSDDRKRKAATRVITSFTAHGHLSSSSMG